MSNQPRMQASFYEGASPTNSMPVVAGGAPRRTGVFPAKIGFMHRHRLAFNVGWTKAGTVVHDSVQDITIQPADVVAAAKWHCTHYRCVAEGKVWASKEQLVRDHGDKRTLDKNGESHLFYAIGKLPADVGNIIGVQKRRNAGGNPIVLVTTEEPITLRVGQVVRISGVRGRGVNDEGKEAMVDLSANGVWPVLPMSMNSFFIDAELDGTFIKQKDPKLPPAVVELAPERPILMSDEA